MMLVCLCIFNPNFKPHYPGSSRILGHFSLKKGLIWKNKGGTHVLEFQYTKSLKENQKMAFF